MNTWVLIFTIFWGRAGGPAVATFHDKAACDFALNEIEKARAKFENQPSFAICVRTYSTRSGSEG